MRYLAFLAGAPSQRPHSHRGDKINVMVWQRMFSRCIHVLPASLRPSGRNPSSKSPTHSNVVCGVAPVISSRNIYRRVRYVTRAPVRLLVVVNFTAYRIVDLGYFECRLCNLFSKLSCNNLYLVVDRTASYDVGIPLREYAGRTKVCCIILYT